MPDSISISTILPSATVSAATESPIAPLAKKSRNFFLVATEWSSGHGGISTFNRDLSIALADQGHKVICLVARASAFEICEANAAKVDLRQVAGFLGLTAGEDWDVDDDRAETSQNLLGNMVLLKSNQNRDLGNLPFLEKKKVCANSGYDLTNQVATYAQWTLEEIRDRQAKLAKLAVKTWPMDL